MFVATCYYLDSIVMFAWAKSFSFPYIRWIATLKIAIFKSNFQTILVTLNFGKMRKGFNYQMSVCLK